MSKNEMIPPAAACCGRRYGHAADCAGTRRLLRAWWAFVGVVALVGWAVPAWLLVG